MRGILAAGAYLPHGRLDRSTIAPIVGSGGGKGTRTVASYDEDTTTMGFEAARLALKAAADDVLPDALWFSTVTPGYVDKTNATTIHAALRLDENVGAFDFGGAQRSVMGMLRAALDGSGTVLTVAADIRTGLPGGPDEAAGGDGASALLVGEGDGVIAEHLASASTTEEFVDRWRRPGEPRSKVWEERFGETRYLPLGEQAFQAALKEAELSRDQVDHLIVTGLHARAATALAKRLGSPDGHVVDTRAATVGNTGAAHPGLLLTSVLETADARPGHRAGRARRRRGRGSAAHDRSDHVVPLDANTRRPGRGGCTRELRQVPLVAQDAARRAAAPSRAAAAVVVGRGTSHRLEVRLRRPQRSGLGRAAVATVAERHRSATDGRRAGHDRDVHRRSPRLLREPADHLRRGRLRRRWPAADRAHRRGEEDVAPGVRVEMTFRKLFTSDDIHNYFWKARLVRGAA